MKTTDQFKKTIQDHLYERGLYDMAFAARLTKEGKSIDDCVTYILNEVQKTGCNGFTDAEIFGMAVHYYDEDDVKVGSMPNARVVVNHEVVLTEAEKEQARKDAVQRLTDETLAKMKQKSKPKPKTSEKPNEADKQGKEKPPTTQPTLF